MLQVLICRLSGEAAQGSPLPVQLLENSDFGWVPAAHRMGSTVATEDGHWIAYTPGKGRDPSSSPILLGPGEYFLMGDNRDNSLDSRALDPVSREQILGKVIAIFQTGQRDSRRD